MEPGQDIFQVTGHVIAMNFDTEKQMTGVVVMNQSGIPTMMEVYDGHLEQLILDLPEGEEATFLYDRYCMLERILEVAKETPADTERKEIAQ